MYRIFASGFRKQWRNRGTTVTERTSRLVTRVHCPRRARRRPRHGGVRGDAVRLCAPRAGGPRPRARRRGDTRATDPGYPRRRWIDGGGEPRRRAAVAHAPRAQGRAQGGAPREARRARRRFARVARRGDARVVPRDGASRRRRPPGGGSRRGVGFRTRRDGPGSRARPGDGRDARRRRERSARGARPGGAERVRRGRGRGFVAGRDVRRCARGRGPVPFVRGSGRRVSRRVARRGARERRLSRHPRPSVETSHRRRVVLDHRLRRGDGFPAGQETTARARARPAV